MSDFIIARSNQKISTIISKKVFEDILFSLPKVISGIKVNTSKSSVLISPDSKYLSLNVFVKIEKNEKLSLKTQEIKQKIENHCLFLLDSKPKNICINYLGDY